jgi:hypothetical protein
MKLRSRIMTDLSEIIVTCQERQETLSRFEQAKNSCADQWKNDATAQWRHAKDRMAAAQQDLQHLLSQAIDLEPQVSHTQCLTTISTMLLTKDKRWTAESINKVLRGEVLE